ncbi:MAG: winged helix-turn-helix transcriptional regulator [Thaumarchaeota archaeon]|nr:winged helix-turn-helix transcriptional regulator [Nitrososphaerota archaeon]MDE1838334.1 winged helix-turn-helix transcriptional regulator [Nitrososphaerota archaeon]
MSDDNDFLVKAQEHIEVISTEDERIKIIGEELANDTGRAIFGKISQGASSTNDLAKSLNISLPLVNWHITRLLGVGLIKVEKTELSSKNKKMKYYGPVKTAFVIVPPTNPAENNISRTKKEAIFMQLRHYLASILAFVIVGPVIYLVEQNQAANQESVREAAQKSLPHVIESLRNNAPVAPFAASRVPNPESTVVSADPMMIAIAISGAAAAFFAVLFAIRAFKKLRKIQK